MKNVKQDEFIWFNKYRPNTVKECILPKEIKQIFQQYVDTKQFPHLLMFGKAGVGKTTVAYALCNEIDADLLYINASNESGIDTIRTKVIQFCSTNSFSGNLKVVLLDEADRLSQAAMEVLRPVMEQFTKSSRFILTGNNKSNISEAIESRCATIDFSVPKSERAGIAAQFLKRLEFILDQESIGYDKKVLIELIMKWFPNNRKIINELQKYSANGYIDEGILAIMSKDSLDKLYAMIETKRFSDARTWVNENSDVDSITLFKSIYETLPKKLEPNSIPELILILSKYQYQSSFAVDQEINTIACIVEIMSSVGFK